MNTSDSQQNGSSPGLAGGSGAVSGRPALMAGVPGGVAELRPFSPWMISPSLGEQINTLRATGFLHFGPEGIFYGLRRRPFPIRFGSDISALLVDQWTLEVSGLFEVRLGRSGLPVSAVISCDKRDPWDEGEPEEFPCEWEPCRPILRDGAGIVGRCQCDQHVTLTPSASGGWKVDR
jgi:hypothetical protein